MDEPIPFNPLAKKHLAASIVAKLLEQPPQPLPPAKFFGAGIYLLYYTGDFAPYRVIAGANRAGRFAQPIYVGKAVPAGARKGGLGLDTPHGDALHERLSKHSKTILAARNLKLDDFQCRWLVVDEVFILLGETMLITHFKPLWNVVVDGFGNNPPGGGRAKGRKPLWDVLHPGRDWAEPLQAAATEADVLAKIQAHFAETPVPPGRISL